MGLKFINLLCNRVKCERTNVSRPSGLSLKAELILKRELVGKPFVACVAVASPQTSFGVCLSRIHFSGNRHLPTMGYSQTFDTHVVSYQNLTMKRILLEKQAYWLFGQGQEKIEEGCKGMFSIFCMHFFMAYQARVTLRNWELST